MNDRTTGTKPIAILLVAVVALAAMAGVAAAAGDLGVTVDDAEGEPTVTVTENDTAVENATVNVTVADPANESYAGAGEYTTDENGTVTLDTPEEGVTVDVTATADNQSASTTVDLEAPTDLALDVTIDDGQPVVTVSDNGDAVENASINVTTADGQNVTYAGNGTYETEENVTVNVAATVGNESISATVDLTVEDVEEPVAEEPVAEDRPFGQFVRDFIDRIGNREGGIGAAVSDFVRENNPGNAPDDAGASGGPNDAAGNASDGDSNAGNAPDQAGNGNGNSGEQGPPDHAGPGGDDADGDDDTDDAEEADESDDADDNGSDAGDDDTDDGPDDDDGGSGAADSSGGSSSGNGNGNGPGNGNGRP